MGENNIGMETVLLQQLNSIQTTVQELARKLDVQNVKLFGEDGSENAQGRLPRLEQTTQQDTARIKRLEENWVRLGVILSLGNISLVAILTAWFHHIWR
jgi:ribosomal 50S subunit-associated protein YjgA (DUF615 family)